MICPLCFHNCDLKEGQTGFCLARKCVDGKVIDLNYGKITSLALDPIEKKPFKRFYPGSYILSVGSYGCNLKCPFCQNSSISYDTGREVYCDLSPEELVDIALKESDNIGIAFTYNEPSVGYEYMYDTFKLAHKNKLKCVIVTNGTLSTPYLEKILPYVDAMNIDLKGFDQSCYDKLQGNLEAVKESIALASKYTHVEVTSLIVPTINDSLEMMEEEAKWLASLDPEIVLHITRFFPAFKMTNQRPTSLDLINEMVGIAKKYLKYVCKGNC